MSKPVLIPVPFNGDCRNWQDWIDHSESVAVGSDGDKLKWLALDREGSYCIYEAAREHAERLR